MGSNIRKALIYIFIIIAFLYLFYLFLLPLLFNCNYINSKLGNIIGNLLKQETKIENLKLSSSPNMLTTISLKSLSTKDKVLILKDIKATFNLPLFDLKTISAQEIYFDKSQYKPKEHNNNFNFTKLPILDIKNAKIIFDKNNKITINNLSSKTVDESCFYDFDATIESNYLNKDLLIKSKNNLYIKDSKIYAQNFAIPLNNNKLNI